MSILLWITLEILKCLNFFCCLPMVVKNSTLKGLTKVYLEGGLFCQSKSLFHISCQHMQLGTTALLVYVMNYLA